MGYPAFAGVQPSVRKRLVGGEYRKHKRPFLESAIILWTQGHRNGTATFSSFGCVLKKFSKTAIRFLPPFRLWYVYNKRRAAMAKLVAIYKKPVDVEAFEKHYFGTHIPL